MLVRKTRPSIGAEGRTDKGAILDVPAARAKEMIDRGSAVMVSEEEAKQLRAAQRKAPAQAQQQPPRTRAGGAPAADPLAAGGGSQSPTGSPTGEAGQSSSSHPVPAQRQRVLTRDSKTKRSS